MPYCGSQWVPATTTTCPGGGKPTATPAGGSTESKPADAPPTITPTYQWNQDTTPLQFGTDKKQSGGYTGIPSGTYDVPHMTNVADAQNEFNKIWGAGTGANASKADKARLQSLIGALRGYTGSKLGTRGSVESAWHDVLKDASRSNVDVMDLLGGSLPTGMGSGRGGSGSYKGPVTTVTQANEGDMRLVADQLGSQILGRAVTDDEFKKALSKVRAAESANPSIAGAGVASQTNVSGLSEAARENAIQKSLLNENGAEDFTLATKMMDLYHKALQEQPNAGQ